MAVFNILSPIPFFKQSKLMAFVFTILKRPCQTFFTKFSKAANTEDRLYKQI